MAFSSSGSRRIVRNGFRVLPPSPLPHSKRWQLPSIRPARRRSLRDQLTRMMLPLVLRDPAMTIVSFILFAILFFAALNIWIFELSSILLGFFVAGLFTLLFVSAESIVQRQKKSGATTKAPSPFLRYFIFVSFPLFATIFVGSLENLLSPVFTGLGIRIRNVSIEVPATELDSIERASETIERPILDCRRTEGGRLLLHDANVLWTAVGSVSLVAFNASQKTDTSLGMKKNISKTAELRFDTESLRIMKSKPRMDNCYDILNDVAFTGDGDELNTAGLLKLRQMAAAFIADREPSRIVVTGHSGTRSPRANETNGDVAGQRLSASRARTIATALKNLLPVKGLVITFDGAGSRQPKVDCNLDPRAATYVFEQCNTPNRRVEVRASYAIPATAETWKK